MPSPSAPPSAPNRLADPADRRPASSRLQVPRDAAGVLAARLAALGTRLTGRNATSIPGFVAELIAPGVTARLAARLGGVVLVSGTNGKTSTSRFLASILEAAGRDVIANRSGANLKQAVASTLVAEATPGGRLRHPGAIAVLEVDEAALPAEARRLPVSVVVMTNLFRDQLDRFGETDHLVRLWTTMLERLPSETIVVSCADDPRLTALVADRPGSVAFGLVSPDATVESAGITQDVSACPVCGLPLTYRWTAVGHLGGYACPGCGFRRPEPWLSVRSTGGDLDGQVLAFRWPGATEEAGVEVRVPGLGNAYNAAAAVTAAAILGVEPAQGIAALAATSVPFARFEELRIDGRRVVLSLVKNPASLGELTRIVADAPVACVLFVFSDNFQDGRDVSWYWDVDPAPMVRGRTFVIAGPRATDFELRLRYELVDRASDPMPGFLGLAPTPAAGLDRAIAATPAGETCVVVSTYTALLALRATLVERGLAPAMPR